MLLCANYSIIFGYLDAKMDSYSQKNCYRLLRASQ